MCPPPCGPKKRSLVEHINSQKIAKREVDEILVGGDFFCLYRMGNESCNHDYDGCIQNLFLILHDKEPRVWVAGSRSKDYLAGFSTIIMKAPCFPATFLLRIKE